MSIFFILTVMLTLQRLPARERCLPTQDIIQLCADIIEKYLQELRAVQENGHCALFSKTSHKIPRQYSQCIHNLSRNSYLLTYVYIFVASNSHINIRESSPYCKITLHVKNITLKSQFLKSVNVQPYVQDSL